MKTLLCLICLNLMFISSAVAKGGTDLEVEGLIGLVRMVRVERAGFSEGSGEWVEGEHEVWYTASYYTDGNLIVRIEEERSTHSYDPNGNKIEETTYDSDGSLQKRWVYSYDNRGNRTEEILYYPDGSLSRKMINAYDVEGRLAEKRETKGADVLVFINFYFYDVQGNLIGEIRDSKESEEASLPTEFAYTYDDKGNRTAEASFTSDGSVYSESIFKYDDKGNRTEEISNQSDGTLLSRYLYAYEYDAVENWIKRTMTPMDIISGEPDMKKARVTYRTITYY